MPPVFFGERSLFFCHALQDLSSQPGIAPRAMAVKAWSPNRWPAREFSRERSLQPVKGTKPQLQDSRCVPLQEIHQELPSLCSPAVQASRAPVNTPSALMHPLGYSEDKHHPLPFHDINPLPRGSRPRRPPSSAQLSLTASEPWQLGEGGPGPRLQVGWPHAPTPTCQPWGEVG